MAASTKKVILLIVDGPSDESALSPILKRIFQSAQVRFHVVHGDITSEVSVDSHNALDTVNERVKMEMDRYGFRRRDILKVVHLIDTDGAFIPEQSVVFGAVETLCYEDDRIVSNDVQQTVNRNKRKTRVLRRLHVAQKVSSYPYAVYYFSRNLEHVLHNESGDLTDAQKAEYADAFADRYTTDPDSFVKFLSDSAFTVQGDYTQTWNFIFAGTNSLHRHCNLHLLFA